MAVQNNPALTCFRREGACCGTRLTVQNRLLAPWRYPTPEATNRTLTGCLRFPEHRDRFGQTQREGAARNVELHHLEPDISGAGSTAATRQLLT